MIRLRRTSLLKFLGLYIFSGLSGQVSTYVDERGIMRWTDTKQEVCAFGVNYSVPFAYPFRAHNYLGFSHEEAIDADVYHLARMGLDGYRIHVWDAEISDSMGNLILNRHLQLFDYLLFKLKERNFKILLTPMNFYTNGYPEPGTSTPGFRNYYDGKRGCLNDTSSFAVQERYLSQFVSHVNPYTGIAYKNDPDIIAFEINNEPFNHGDRPDLTTHYINRMIGAIRVTGCRKPVFYNVSHNINLIDEFSAGDIQGGTFQWYPTGLVARHDQKGNLLPNVDRYTIPFADHPRFSNMSKVVYEFSPADVARSSHLYPVMARSFREAGMQFAAQFAYDPMHMAYANTDYASHYLNLPFAPRNSMGMMIASEAFHRIPLGKSYGHYPDNMTFDVFRVSYEDDLAEMVTDKKLLYTNHTGTSPPRPERLEQVAGTGISPIVSYEGTGAYFLDRLEAGVWRLEVMPDAVWVNDPFGPPSLDKEVSVVLWREWPITIDLPDLGDDFSITGLNDGNQVEIIADGKHFPVRPGSYLLVRKGKSTQWDPDDTWKNIILKEYHAPGSNCRKTYVIHNPPAEISAGTTNTLFAKVVTVNEPGRIELVFTGSGGRETVPMTRTAGYEYAAEVPVNYLQHKGFLRYYICVWDESKCMTFPPDKDGHPFDWDFYDRNPWQVRIVYSEDPVCVFDAAEDGTEITKSNWRTVTDFVPSEVPGKAYMLVKVADLKSGEHDYSMRSFFGDKITYRQNDLETKDKIVIHGYSLNGKPCKLQLALIMKDGTAYGGIYTLQQETDRYSLSLDDFSIVKTVNLPRPFPGFLPYWFDIKNKSEFDLKQIESLQISIGPGIPEREYDEPHGVAIDRIYLE